MKVYEPTFFGENCVVATIVSTLGCVRGMLPHGGPFRWIREHSSLSSLPTAPCSVRVLIDIDGQALAFGENSRGGLGVGDTAARFEPTLVQLRGARTPLTIHSHPNHSFVD